VDEFPATMEIAMRKEVKHLQDNSVELIAHGLNLHRHALYESNDIAATVAASRAPLEFDIDEKYEARVKTLYSAIVEFATRATSRDIPPKIANHVHALRDAAQASVRAVKAIKHMRSNATNFTKVSHGTITDLYNGLRSDIGRILVEMHKLDESDPELRSSLSLDEERLTVEQARKTTTRTVEGLLLDGKITATEATSFLNDSGYAYQAMNDLIETARVYYLETEDGVAEVERILALEDEDIEELSATG
jgi:phosphate:Na+ symporter